MNVIEKLNSVGIESGVWRKKKTEPYMMELYANRKKIKIHQPNSVKCKVSTNKKLEQAVITIMEPERHWEESVDLHTYFEDLDVLIQQISEKEFDALERIDDIKNDIEVNRTSAENSTFKILSIVVIPYYDYEREDADFEPSGYADLNIKYQITAPESTQCFLVGKDESHYFISQLPEVARNVNRAHEILRPKVRKNAVRIGEWFFDPVSRKKNDELLRAAFSNDKSGYYMGKGTWYHEYTFTDEFGNLDSDEAWSDNHRCCISLHKNRETYVFGEIYDVDKRHDPVFLNRFHKIVRNNEVINTSERYD